MDVSPCQTKGLGVLPAARAAPPDAAAVESIRRPTAYGSGNFQNYTARKGSSIVVLEFSMFPLDKGESLSRYVARSLDIIDAEAEIEEGLRQFVMLLHSEIITQDQLEETAPDILQDLMAWGARTAKIMAGSAS